MGRARGWLLPVALLLPVLVIIGVVQGTQNASAVGNKSAWVQRFDSDVSLGSVAKDGTFPGYSWSQLRAYPDGLRTTHGGQYEPSRVNSIENGVLTWHTQSGGVGSSVSIGPSAIGGEWSVRMRTDMIEGMHIADMRWPDNDVWPGTNGSGGEIDFPEEDLTNTHPYAAVVGNAGERRNGEQLFNPYPLPHVAKPWTEWHTYTTQVDPGKSVVMYQDGVEVGRVTENVPRTAIKEQFQVEPQEAGKGGEGTVQVSGVAYSPNLDRSTIGQVGGTSSGSSASTSAGGAASSSSSTRSRGGSAMAAISTSTGSSSGGSSSPSRSASSSSASPSSTSSDSTSSVSASSDSTSSALLGSTVLSDRFDGDGVSSARWASPSGDACRVGEALRVGDGRAAVRAPGDCDSSAALTATSSTGSAYGYFEARMTLPSGGDKPAFDLVAADPSAPTIRVVAGTSGGSPCFDVTARDSARWCASGVGSVRGSSHLFGALVRPDGVTFYLDRSRVGQWRGAVADTPRRIAIGLQNRSSDDSALEIDRVTAWHLGVTSSAPPARLHT